MNRFGESGCDDSATLGLAERPLARVRHKQEFDGATIQEVVGYKKTRDVHIHLGGAAFPDLHPPTPPNLGDDVHLRWAKEDAEDLAFARSTKLKVTRPERLALQELIYAGVRKEHCRLLWMAGSLRLINGELMLVRKRQARWIGSALFAGIMVVAIPAAHQFIYGPSQSATRVVSFLVFALVTTIAAFAMRSHWEPWRLAGRYASVVDDVNKTLRAKR